VFLASSGRRADESDKPLVDASAVVQTVLRERHDVGVVEGVDNAASNSFLRLRDQGEGHLIDVSHVHKGEALIGVRVVEDGATDGLGRVDSEELLESTVRGGNPRGAADGEGLEEAFAALLADALSVLLSGSKHREKQKVRKRRGFNTGFEREQGESEGTSSDRKTTDLDAEDAEFRRSERSERSGAVREQQGAPMVTERQEEPQTSVRRRRTYSSSTVYGDFSRGSRKK
jgi:hypothetical protein